MPVRIQRRRAKGWRMPPGAVYVGRPTRFGNPFSIHEDVVVRPKPDPMWAVKFGPRLLVRWDSRALAAADAVDRFRRLLHEDPEARAIARELRGKDLVCWCPLGQPCHADVLLELANKETA